MASFGVTSPGPSKRRLLPGAQGHETIAAVGTVLVALAAFVFVLIVLPWVISI
jgi:hypothetical protein